jgi:hypothetical protein
MNPESAISDFQRNTLRFLLAQGAILGAELVARKDNEELKKRFDRFSEISAPTYDDLYEYLCAHLFIAYISSFEIFLQNICTFVVRKHPKKLGAIQFKLSDILDTGNPDQLVERAIEEFLNRMMYKRPMEYLVDLCDLLSIEKASLIDNWKTFVEAKARRDLGVHAGWKCNETYIRKVEESGDSPLLKVGESAVPDTEAYIDDVASKLDQLAIEITKKLFLFTAWIRRAISYVYL